jgi:hypothetical protein
MFSPYKALCSVFMALCISCIFPLRLQAEYTQLKVTAKYNDLSDLILRGIIHYHIIKAFCILENDRLDSFGFSTPFSVMGPLIQSGLLREIMNPLAYTATSSVFREKTDLRLTAALSGSSYWGLALKPFPDNFFLYYLGKRDRPFIIGAAVRLEWSNLLLFESLIATSEQPQQQLGDIWFEDKPLFAGGRLVHISPRFKLTWHDVSFIISGSLSCGQLVMPGYFFHAVSCIETDIVQISFIFGHINDNYVNPYGEYNDKNVIYGGNIRITPCSWLELEQGYSRLIFRSQPSRDPYRECKEKLSSVLEISIPISEMNTLCFNTEYDVSFHFLTDGEDNNIHTTASAVSLEIYDCELTAELRFDHIGLADQSMTVVGKLDLVIGPAVINILLERFAIECKTSYSAALSLSVQLENHEFYIEASTKKSKAAEEMTWQNFSNDFIRYISVTLGWEAVW